ncbi:hypothetical protein BGW36DRAFT_293843 [Talaromyces proteolyticus]|uniref:Polyketide synthase n=1 Tax=Talaromyces proteolyticus TaxID=1131652 RepID=A0AAD4Q151_9EURO|nr:uncharacterized protein BGW36DRAFT_293843 [Talaromyces proteolyticus]KAH8698369.1 hypothetical protein BGW36DRAFT_293843 [Talaromyces proteolyticus]
MRQEISNQEQCLLLYGDQTVEKLPAIRALVQQSQRSEIGRRFLRDACDIVQQETFQLQIERAKITQFDTLLQLAENNARSEEPSEIVATVLMNVARLGELILYAEEDPQILGSADRPTHILGFCTGEMPAAVAATARSIPELYNLSVEVLRVICRFARNIIRRSVLIDRTNGNWATTIVGLPTEHVQAILDDFHQSQKIAPLRQICIGFISVGWLTLFGPPTTVEQLFSWSRELDEASRIKTDAGGGVHMSNLPELDLDEVVGSSSVLEVPINPNAKFWSPYNCEIRSAPTLRDMLHQVVSGIAQDAIRLSETIDLVVKSLNHSPVKIVSVGYTHHLATLQKSLQRAKIPFTVMQHSNSPEDLSGPLVRGGSDLIAIVGMSGRFPGSENVQDYWKSLLDGERYIRDIPPERFNLDKWFDATGKQKNATVNRTGAFLDRPGYFDNRLFNMSPREAIQTDPLHRLFLTVSYEALEMAGYSPDATLSTNSNRIATYFGQTSDDWRDILLTQGVDIYYASGICRAFAPGRLNYHFKWGGPSYSIDAACASSVATISLACSALMARECDTALAGGGSILDSPAPFAGLSRGGFLSPERGCETFHEDADGYVRGEGVGVVVLKRLEDAIADNDNILSVIRGSARNYNKGASSITHPSAEDQQRLYQQVLSNSAVDPSSVAYVEMHGTGTQAGDSTEMSSVLSAFGHGRSKENPLVLGAVKASIGHGEAAAGVCALIKVLMMLQQRTIPPQPGMPFQMNHRFPDLGRMNVHIPSGAMPLYSADKNSKLRVFLNSFDASGGNSCLLLEEAPLKPVKGVDPRKHHVVSFSARSPYSLRGIKERYLEYLYEHPGTSLVDLAYSTTARRMHHTSVRSVFTASSIEEFTKILEEDLSKPDPSVKKGKGSPPGRNVVFAFTGQGSQYAGMAHQLWNCSTVFRGLIESIQTMATAQGLPSFVDLIAQSDLDLSETSPVNTQLAIVAVEIALAQLWISWGVKPSLVIGHSLGEYAALCISGVLTISDTVYLVGQRALTLVQSAKQNEYAMLAINGDVDTARQYLSKGTYDTCEVACLNAPKSTVVSGSLPEVKALKGELEAQGTRSTLLQVPFGFHSKQMDPILDSYESCAKGVAFSVPQIPIASTLLGDVVQDEFVISPVYLRRQTRESVNFVGAIGAAQAGGFIGNDTLFLEIGPDPVCISLIRSTLGAASVPRLLSSLRRNEDNWLTTSNSLATIYETGLYVNWPEYHREFSGCLSLLDLPTYAFDEKDFWMPYPDPDQPHAIEKTQLALPSIPAVPGFPTTTLQRVKQEAIDEGKISVTFESSTSEPHLLSAIVGHAVAGVTICSSSIFSDMALSAVRYAFERLHPGKWTDEFLTISSLNLHRPIVIANGQPSQTIEVNVKLESNTEKAQITFSSQAGDATHSVGSAKVSLRDAGNWQQNISRSLFLIRSRIDALKEAKNTTKGQRLLRPVVYRLFSNVVDYGELYQGLEEVFLDSELRDVVGQIKLPTLPSGESSGTYLYSPYLLDAIVHVAGFLANCGLRYPEDVAFLASSFEAWHILKPLSSQKAYTSYAHMEESADGNSLLGDVFVFEDNVLVTALIGVRFQKMKKMALTKILQSAAPGSTVQKGTGSQYVGEAEFESPSSSADPSTFTTPRATSVATSVTSVDEDTGIIDKFLTAVATEVGCEVSELEPDTVFADLGVDSLMAITVIASIRNETGVELPGSFFLDHQTVAEAMKELKGGGDSGVATPQFTPPDASPKVGTEPVENSVAESTIPPQPLENQNPPASESKAKPEEAPARPVSLTTKPAPALLLQGSMSSTEAPLFLLADGTGSVSSYIQLPALPGGRRIYGIESPFARDPSALVDVSVEQLVGVFVSSIRKIQPTGPYSIGGYSIGAIYAFEVSRRLLEASEAISELLLIANPAPIAAPTKLRGREITYGTLQEGGFAYANSRTKVAISGRQKQHLAAAVQALLQYEPKSLPQESRPGHLTLIIPSKGLGDAASTAETPFTAWLHANWDSSKNLGWESLVGSIDTVHKQETDCFSLLKYPEVSFHL